MSALWANIVGIAGSILILVAYGYNVMADSPNALPYNIVNLLGAGLLTLSLLVHFNLASFMLEIVWMVIAVLGIAKALRTKGVPQ